MSQDIGNLDAWVRCRRPGWSSPPSSSRASPRPRSPAGTAFRGLGQRLMARYRAEGDAAFEPRSRRPTTSPDATPTGPSIWSCELRKQLTESGLDAGADTIAWHLAPPPPGHPVAGHDQPDPDPRRLGDPGAEEAPEVLLHPLPGREAQRDLAVRLHPLPTRRPAHRHVEIITWLDDHSRYALHVSAHLRITGPIVLATFRETAAQHGYPASTLTDNGMVYTTRFAGGRGGRNQPRERTATTRTSSRRTPARTTPPPAGRSNDSSRP